MKSGLQFGALSLAGLLVLGACETPPPAPPRPPALAPLVIAPPPPEAPPVRISDQLIELASTYRAAMAAAAAISPNFQDGDDVATAVRTSASYEQVQLEQGAIAYAAIAALQEPSFVHSVREYSIDPTARQDMVRRLRSDPNYVSVIDNVENAAGLAIAAIDGTGARVHIAGQAVKQSAYDIQRQPWSRVNIENTQARLDLAKNLSTQRQLAGEMDVAALREAALGDAALSLAGEPVRPPYTSTIARGLTIAALAALGEAADDDMTGIAPLLSDATANYCLNMAKLNFFQCLAVSRPHYEDVFCMGQHAMIDTGQCMVKAAGSPNPIFSEAPTRTSATP
jgi:hypothetical protein